MFRQKTILFENYGKCKLKAIDRGFGRSPRYRIELTDTNTNVWVYTHDLFGRNYFENAINQFRVLAAVYRDGTDEQRAAMRTLLTKYQP